MNVIVQHTRSKHHTGISFVPSFLSVLTRPNDTSTFSDSHQKSAGFYVIVVGEVPDFTTDFPQSNNVKYRMLVLIYDKKFLEFFRCCGSFFLIPCRKYREYLSAPLLFLLKSGGKSWFIQTGPFVLCRQ